MPVRTLASIPPARACARASKAVGLRRGAFWYAGDSTLTKLNKADLIARVRALTERKVVLYFCSCDGEKIPIEVASSCTVTQLRALIMQLCGEAIVDGFQILKSPLYR